MGRKELRKAAAQDRIQSKRMNMKIHPTKGHPINRMSKGDRWAISQDAKEQNANKEKATNE